jgi:phosphatidylinositol alpha-1,6-mannosyltransferase
MSGILALITDGFGGAGGIAQYNRDLIKALTLCPGIERVTVLPRLGNVDAAALPAGVRHLKPRRNAAIYSLAAIKVALTQGPFDAVFCGHLHLAPLARCLASWLGVPLWLQLHGWEAWRVPRRIERQAAERARLITAVSRTTRTRFLAVCGVHPVRVRILPPTVDQSFHCGARSDELAARYGLRGKRVLLTVGRLDPAERRKGQDQVIRALPGIIAAFPDVVYLIVGGGADAARLETLARELGVADHVVFAGTVSADELPQLYRLADVFVMPSTQEGFGIVFLEAAASGLRVIGGNADGSADALADGAIGTLIDPADTAVLVRAVTAALSGGGAEPTDVARFRFENFSQHVRELTKQHLFAAAQARAA